MSGVIAAALPLLAPQSFAQGTLERRVASTKDTAFMQTVSQIRVQVELVPSRAFVCPNTAVPIHTEHGMTA